MRTRMMANECYVTIGGENANAKPKGGFNERKTRVTINGQMLMSDGTERATEASD